MAIVEITIKVSVAWDTDSAMWSVVWSIAGKICRFERFDTHEEAEAFMHDWIESRRQLSEDL